MESFWVEPGSAPKPLKFTPIRVNKRWAAFNANGGRWPLGVILTPEGEVWTWGRVLGEYTPARTSLQSLAKIASHLHWDVDWGESQPVTRPKTWLLPVLNLDNRTSVGAHGT